MPATISFQQLRRSGPHERSLVKALAHNLLPDSFPRLTCAAVLCFLTSWGALELSLVPAQAAILWPANGIILAFLLGVPRRCWASYLASGILASITLHLLWGFTDATAWIFTGANAVETLLAAWWLSDGVVKIELRTARGLARFLAFGVILAPLVSTTLIETILFLDGRPARWLGLTNWYMGDVMGIAIMTPLMLAVLADDLRALIHPAKLLETMAIFCGITLLTVLIFDQRHSLLICLLPVVLLTAIFRLGTGGAAIALFLVLAPAAWLTIHQHGPLAPAGPLTKGTSVYSIFSLQCLLAILLVTIYTVSAELSERDARQRQLTEAYNEAKVHAGIDHTTGIANRRSFDRELSQEWRRAMREGVTLALVMIDIDRFKQYNDCYGHPAGDACLRAVAQILAKGPMRASDTVARYGGEEFVVLLPRAGIRGAEIFGEVVRQAVLDALLPHIGSESGIVTISAGAAAIRPAESLNETVLVELADNALYRAKKEGRNRVCSSVVEAATEP